MTTTWPLTKDTFTTKVDNTDDVMASHINNPQDSIVALEDLRDYSLMRVKNTSGSTVAANDLGRINANSEFKLVSSAYLDLTACIVIAGAANNADIIVARRGRVTIQLNGNCSINDFLYFSTTSKQAQPQDYCRPEVVARAITANASGAGGTCEALLLTGRILKPLSSGEFIINIATASDSDWRSTQNGAPAAAVITYNVGLTSGSEDTIVPTTSTALGKLVLHNTTLGEEALIESVNIGANTITVTDADDVSAWVNTNVLVVRSQTNTAAPGGVYFFDIKFEDASVIPTLAVGFGAYISQSDTGAANAIHYIHPWKADAASERQTLRTQVAGIAYNVMTPMIPIIQRRFVTARNASGAGTMNASLRLLSVVEAVP